MDSESLIRKIRYMDVDANLLQENLAMIVKAKGEVDAKRLLKEKDHLTSKDREMYDVLDKILGREKFAEIFFEEKDYYRWTSAVKKFNEIKDPAKKVTLETSLGLEQLYNFCKYKKTFKKFDKVAMEEILKNPDSPKNLKRFIQFNLDQKILMIDYKKFIYESISGE